jgi:hypothetical protein
MARKYVSNLDGILSLGPGDYCLNPRDGNWYVRAPVNEHQHFLGNLARHKVVEHEDGTITVSPSILITAHDDRGNEIKWHGYLERGVWREC